MKIPIPLQLAVLAVSVTGFYTLVGQAVPQKEVHPPEVIEMDTSMSTTEMVDIGKGIFEGKGICNTCHTIGKTGALRFPDMAGVGQTAATRIPDYTALDYFAESLYEPNIFIVSGFSPGMPAINKPPIGLTDQEILAVIAYLQTLGGEATVTMETKLAYTGGTRENEAGAEADETMVAETGEATPDTPTPLGTFGCTACHGGSAGGLDSYGTGHGADEILVTLSRHDRLSPSSNAGIDELTLSDVQSLVQYLSAQRGDA